jgi:tRNA 2-thiouridine synthesizing protein A
MNKSDLNNLPDDWQLDTSGLRCPIPIMRTKREISKLTFGAKLLVIATDPSFKLDCLVFARQTGHLLLQSWQEDEKFYFLLQKNSK